MIWNSLDNFESYAKIYAKNMASIHKQTGKPNLILVLTMSQP
jgi:hypothetical protein